VGSGTASKFVIDGYLLLSLLTSHIACYFERRRGRSDQLSPIKFVKFWCPSFDITVIFHVFGKSVFFCDQYSILFFRKVQWQMTSVKLND
jgi:hypothetical protein